MLVWKHRNLLDSICYWKSFKVLSIVLIPFKRVILELLHRVPSVPLELLHRVPSIPLELLHSVPSVPLELLHRVPSVPIPLVVFGNTWRGSWRLSLHSLFWTPSQGFPTWWSPQKTFFCSRLPDILLTWSDHHNYAFCRTAWNPSLIPEFCICDLVLLTNSLEF